MGLSLLLIQVLGSHILGTAPADAQVGIETTRLTDFQTRRGAVAWAARSADGQWVVYRASQESAGRIELYAVPAAGGVATKLSQPLVAGGNVLEFVISPDSSTVAFRADAEVALKQELYRVPITGGSVTKVNGPMVPGGDVSDFRFTDDSTHLVYTATQRHFQIQELFSHTLADGTVSMLSPQLGVGGEIIDFGFSPDSSRAVFIAADPDDGDLYSAPIGGGGATQLGDPPSLPDTIRQFEILADNTTVLFTRASNSVDSELLSTTITGGAVTSVGPAGMVVRRHFEITPGESHLVFTADFEAASAELFSLDLATEDFTLLSGTSSFIRDIFVSPDNQHVVFCGEAFSGPQLFEGLAIVPLTGGSVVELDSTVFDLEALEFSPDGSRLLYRTEFGIGGLNEIFSVPADGSTPPVNLVPQAVEDGVRQAAFDTTGDNVLFRSDHDPSEIFGVYTVPWNGGAITRLNDALVEGGDVVGAFFDGDTVLYWADQEEVGVVELFTVASVGGATTKLNPPFLGTAGRTRLAELTSDGQTAVFTADQATFGQIELWSYDLSGSGPAVRLSEAPFAESQVEGFPVFRIDPSGQRVVFRASREDPDVHGLYSTSVEGGPVEQLDDPTDGSVFRYEMTADGQWVVYGANGPTTDFRFFRTAVTQSDVRLLFDGGSDGNFKLSPDGQFMLLIDDGQLLSIPIDSGDPVVLSTLDQTLNSNVREIAITPDSSRVVYRAVSTLNNREELHSVPILGGGTTVLGTDAALCNSNHDNLVTPVITPDSSRVLFLCGPAFFPTLHSAPVLGGPTVALIDGNDHLNFGTLRVSPDSQYVVVRFFVATSNTKLVGIPVEGGEETVHFAISDFDTVRDVGDFRFSPDSSTLFFLGDDDPVISENLFSTPLGPGDPTQVNPEGNVTSFVIAPDGSRIFYTSTPLFFDQPRRADLVSIPLAGGPVLAHHPALPDGRFASFRDVTDDGRGVLYIADQDQNDTFDLYFARTTQLFIDGFESGDTSRWSNVAP